MTPEDIAGHNGYLWLIVGTWLLANKNIWGWLIRLVGEGIWVGIGIHMHMSSIWIWGLIFMALEIRGFYKWRKEYAANQNSKC